MAHDARAVANRVLDIADELKLQLTLMQLIKLVHLANGWWMAFSKGEPLVEAEAQAWQYGPVHPQVYRAFRKSGSNPIAGRAVDRKIGMLYTSDFNEEEDSLIEQVVEVYGDKHAFQLSDMMHRVGTPWHTVYHKDGAYAPIPHRLVFEHFDELRRQRTKEA